MSEKRCIGFGANEGTCDKPITADDLALNDTGLWCRSCETNRRDYITDQFAAITASFPDTQQASDE